MTKTIYSLLIVFLCSGCSFDIVEPTPTPTLEETLYITPLTSTNWKTKSITSLG